MGSQQSIQKCNFEDVQRLSNLNSNTQSSTSTSMLLVNTMPGDQQSCLIKKTTPIQNEAKIINDLIQNGKQMNITIIIYGKNSNDETIYKKYKQLVDLGFTNVYLYIGGMFEWLCLQDIYGSDEFPSTSREIDILKYKPVSHNMRNSLLLMD
jgi:hypothetical protein